MTFFTILTILMFNLIDSRLGRELKASRDDRLAASLMGFNTTASRMKALLISAFYCGVSNTLLGFHNRHSRHSPVKPMRSWLRLVSPNIMSSRRLRQLVSGAIRSSR